ncbi:23S rRNA m(5)U-1939 methyltransferase [Granulicella rosea]|uniref:23S rRNA m(5)U-1939 methyltransferase n=1 Tax=Granulicella rosea TaxID=474952 RepID=A0A239KU94_9BACT|nr:23S rRNA (uracil(1939)-C(5))-methyltransferase RlmD [Granulicella rosea]SNT21069.1 23S rRNA m(5)U-1939 methyltransferase [Granulicella rosea]
MNVAVETVRLEKALYGGLIEGTADGKQISVSYALPGELVEIRDGELAAVLEPSPARIAPACVHFGQCGGCQYQHASYPTQTELKAGILRVLFAAEGLTELPPIQPHTADPWGYRNRVRMRVAVVAGKVQVGYSRRASNEFLPIAMCPIAAPLLWRAAEALIRLAAEDATCRRWLAAATEVELFCAPDESRLQIGLFLRDADTARFEKEGFTGFCERVKAAVPELTGAGMKLDPELSRRTRKGWDGANWGAAGLNYDAAGTKYWVSRGAFFQVNRFLVEELVALVAAGRKGALAWDLFAGVGLFSQALAAGFDRIVAVEGGEVAALDLAQVERKTSGKVQAVHAPTLDFLRAQVLQRTRPELIVMDPPRAGVGAEGCHLLGRLRAPELVYVSCDPVTLARDLKVLTGAGYRVDQLHMVDLFPQTFHMESVVVLRFADQ